MLFDIVTWYSLELLLVGCQPVHLQADVRVNDLPLSTAWLGQRLTTDDSDRVVLGSHSWDVIMTLGIKHTILCAGNTARSTGQHCIVPEYVRMYMCTYI